MQHICRKSNPFSPRHLVRSRRSDKTESEDSQDQDMEDQTMVQTTPLVPVHKYSVGNWTIKWDYTYNAWYYWDTETG